MLGPEEMRLIWLKLSTLFINNFDSDFMSNYLLINSQTTHP